MRWKRIYSLSILKKGRNFFQAEQNFLKAQSYTTNAMFALGALLLVASYLIGYSIGLEDKGPLGSIISLSLKIWYFISGWLICAVALIILIIFLVTTDAIISFNWAQFMGGCLITISTFIIGLLFGKNIVHYKIGIRVGWKRLEAR